MKKIARLDYLDIQIYDELRTTLLVPQKDEDGLGTDCCAEITESIIPKIEPEKLMTLMVAQVTKRIKLSPEIQNLLLKVSI